MTQKSLTFAEQVFCENSPVVVDSPKSEISLERMGGAATAADTEGRLAGPILDTHTPPKDNLGECVKRVIGPRNRKMFSRLHMGMMLGGRCYFLTLTSSPKSPKIESSWFSFRRWLKRERPLTSWCKCITSEGYGVIHLALRLGLSEKRVDVKRIRAFWESVHKASQVRILVTTERDKLNLANYISDQRKKKGLAGEFLFQDQLVSWRCSRGWLPVGFTRAFGRFWWAMRDIAPTVRDSVLKEWLIECSFDPSRIPYRPIIKNGVVFYHDKTNN
jgi:hypothetical protein